VTATCPAHIGLHLTTLVPFDKALHWVTAFKLQLIPSLSPDIISMLLLNVSAYLLPSVKVKVKFTLEQVTKAQRVVEI